MARPVASIAVLPPSCASRAWVALFELVVLDEPVELDELVVLPDVPDVEVDVPVPLVVLAVVPLVEEIVVMPDRTAGLSRG